MKTMSRTIWKIAVRWMVCFFIVLLVYSAVSNILKFENFQNQLMQAELIGEYAQTAAYFVIALQLLIVGFLCFGRTRWLGLLVVTIMFLIFEVYLFYIITYSQHLPCTCLAFLENKSWDANFIFNSMCTCAAIISLINYQNK